MRYLPLDLAAIARITATIAVPLLPVLAPRLPVIGRLIATLGH